MDQKKSVLPFLSGITICLLLGFFSGKITSTSVTTWYPTIAKPAFTPPDWVFAPVWTFLYILMGIAFGIVWNAKRNHPARQKALFFFFLQLILNGLWTYFFFGVNQLGWASVEIIILWLTIENTIWYFYRINKLAAWLMAPYVLWVTFASVLTLTIWSLN
jgi:tryptophan-rich sensory protein